MEAKITEKANYWANGEVFDAKTREEIGALLAAGRDEELVDRFYRDLEFGTGGLRGIIAAGTNRMNIYNVRKATYAVATYLKQVFKDQDQLKVAITHDSRRFSREFALETAMVLAALGIKALITKELRPVPMLSFMVRKYSCHAGICITASHNPPEYNGYKVYWQTGGQLVAPHDKNIIAIYNSTPSYDAIASLAYEKGLKEGLIAEVGAELDEDYLAQVAQLSLRSEGRGDFKVVYSSLHGTGAFPVMAALKRFGFNQVWIVPEQEKPDGDFPTVKTPNPEDHNALKMAVGLAQKLGADMVLATDPDSDRLGMAVRENGEFTYFNGNQIGSLLCEYILSSLKERGRLSPDALVVKTVVTTDLEADIASHYGISCEETLTGFKWICDLVEQYESGAKKPYKRFICGGEESYGFLVDSFVRDKDAVISCSLAAEMVAHYKTKGLTPSALLDELFRRHGIYLEDLHTITLPGLDGSRLIEQKMGELRQNPLKVIDGVAVKKLKDFEIRQELLLQENNFQKCSDICLPKSNVLQFILEDGTKVTVRPSGTEPKIKFYFSIREPIDPKVDSASLARLKEACQERIERIKDTFVKIIMN